MFMLSLQNTPLHPSIKLLNGVQLLVTVTS